MRSLKSIRLDQVSLDSSCLLMRVVVLIVWRGREEEDDGEGELGLFYVMIADVNRLSH